MKNHQLIFLAVLFQICNSHRAVQVPVPGLPANTDPTTIAPETTTTTALPTGPLLLDSYLAPSMQALAYYIELLQYEPAEMTTLEPPFSGWEAEGGTTYKPPPTPPRPSTTTKSSTIWWKPPPSQSTVWWVPPSTTPKPSTTKPTTTTTTKRTTTTKKPTSYHDEVTTIKPSSTTQWWHTTTTPQATTTTTTIKPVTWWQPPAWWTSSTTNKPTTTTKTTTTAVPAQPTQSHGPGLFAPLPPFYTKPKIPPPIKNNSIHEDTTQKLQHRPPHTTVAPLSITSDKNFFAWFFQKKAKLIKPEFEYDFNLLDPLPAALIQDIIYERSELPAISDEDNVNELLRVFDDNFGRYRSSTGKKRIPITKPYVEFLMLYDLLKRDAKAMNLSKYEGYTAKMLTELTELSKRSAERQLHTLFTRMLLRNDIERADVINKVKNIIKDLENPLSITAKAMRYFPPLPFVP